MLENFIINLTICKILFYCYAPFDHFSIYYFISWLIISEKTFHSNKSFDDKFYPSIYNFDLRITFPKSYFQNSFNHNRTSTSTTKTKQGLKDSRITPSCRQVFSQSRAADQILKSIFCIQSGNLNKLNWQPSMS